MQLFCNLILFFILHSYQEVQIKFCFFCIISFRLYMLKKLSRCEILYILKKFLRHWVQVFFSVLGRLVGQSFVIKMVLLLFLAVCLFVIKRFFQVSHLCIQVYDL